MVQKKTTTHCPSSTEKECFICHEIKPLDDFYKEPRMKDGHFNKCKECDKQRMKQRYYNMCFNDPSFIESERERSREKHKRLGYSEKQKTIRNVKPYKKDQVYVNIHKILSERGLIERHQNAHHWNYSKINDVFILSTSDHRFVHTKIRLDESLLLFRDKDNGAVIYNVEDHMDLLEGYGIEYKHIVL